MTFAVWADTDKIASSDSRAELRGFLRDADFKAWAVGAGYRELFISIDGFRTFDCVDLKGYSAKVAT